MKKKIVIILLSIALLLVIIGAIIFINLKDNKEIANSDLTLDNINYKLDNGVLIYTATLINNTNDSQNVESLVIDIYLKDGESFSITKYIQKTINSNDSEELSVVINVNNYNLNNLNEITKINYEIK